jgi:hypothetical protein
MQTRNYNHVNIWNEVGLSDDNTSVSHHTVSNQPAAIALLKTNAYLVNTLAYIAHEVEIVHNLLNFADPRISLIIYGLLFVVAVVFTLWLTFFSVCIYDVL